MLNLRYRRVTTELTELMKSSTGIWMKKVWPPKSLFTIPEYTIFLLATETAGEWQRWPPGRSVFYIKQNGCSDSLFFLGCWSLGLNCFWGCATPELRNPVCSGHLGHQHGRWGRSCHEQRRETAVQTKWRTTMSEFVMGNFGPLEPSLEPFLLNPHLFLSCFWQQNRAGKGWCKGIWYFP